MVQKIVITGGPFSGKTELLKKIRLSGYRTFTDVPQTIRKNEQDKAKYDKTYQPILPETHFESFQDLVIQKQKELEALISPLHKITFQDKGFIDHYVHCSLEGMQPQQQLQNAIKQANYSFAFVCDLLNPPISISPLEIKNKQREIQQALISTYKAFNIPFEIVPQFSKYKNSAIKQRYNFIQQQIVCKELYHEVFNNH
ncbi:MAG: AAA family ATPase [Candidatus Nanoarchaeia archaeon]